MNDKIPVILAIVILAILATYASIKPTDAGQLKELLAFFIILSSGLFGLVTGMAIERASNNEKADN